MRATVIPHPTSLFNALVRVATAPYVIPCSRPGRVEDDTDVIVTVTITMPK